MNTLVEFLVLLVVVVVGCIIVDKTMTGEAAPFNWIAKLIIGLLALVMILVMLGFGGFPSLHFGR